VLYGDEIGGLGMFFDARLRAMVKDGTVHADANGLSVRNATEVTLILAAGTSFNGFDKSPSREGADAAARSRRDRAGQPGQPLPVSIAGWRACPLDSENPRALAQGERPSRFHDP